MSGFLVRVSGKRMQIPLFLWLAFLLTDCFTGVQARDLALSTPEATVRTHYRAIKSLDLDLLKRAHSDVNWVKREQIEDLSRTLASYKIVKKGRIKTNIPNEKGDVYVVVRERFTTTSTPSLMYFVLRRRGDYWLIVSFNTEEEQPPSPSEVEKRAREIVK